MVESPAVFGRREHRSDRPAVWDYSNPREERRVSLRRRLAARPRTRKKKK